MTQFIWQDRDKRSYDYPFSPRPECLAMIQRTPSAALDIGCGSGGVGHALRERYPHCELWGCELDANAAGMAREHFDHVVEQNIEEVDFAALGLSRPFDLVCLFDVLEHLVNPWELLRALLSRITPDAHLIVSLPNASNLLLLHDALRGYWPYRNWGLLDFTHLRFFTDFDARKMFYQTGYRVVEHRKNFCSKGAEIYQSHQNGSYPTVLRIGAMTLKIDSREELARLCAVQNLYRITPHHDRFVNEDERRMASSDYPQVYALGG